jgi:hypothetical protein
MIKVISQWHNRRSASSEMVRSGYKHCFQVSFTTRWSHQMWSTQVSSPFFQYYSLWRARIIVNNGNTKPLTSTILTYCWVEWIKCPSPLSSCLFWCIGEWDLGLGRYLRMNLRRVGGNPIPISKIFLMSAIRFRDCLFSCLNVWHRSPSSIQWMFYHSYTSVRPSVLVKTPRVPSVNLMSVFMK